MGSLTVRKPPKPTEPRLPQVPWLFALIYTPEVGQPSHRKCLQHSGDSPGGKQGIDQLSFSSTSRRRWGRGSRRSRLCLRGPCSYLIGLVIEVKKLRLGGDGGHFPSSGGACLPSIGVQLLRGFWPCLLSIAEFPTPAIASSALHSVFHAVTPACAANYPRSCRPRRYD